MAIISSSRRTDIPAFFCEWFLNRMKEGYALVRNPRSPHQISQVLLDHDNVDAFVFWTKNSRPFERALDYLQEQGYPCYFQFTLNDYPRIIEPHVPPLAERIQTLISLAHRLGPQHIMWRYDPIILTESVGPDDHIANFENLCRQLAGHITECTFNPYPATCQFN